MSSGREWLPIIALVLVLAFAGAQALQSQGGFGLAGVEINDHEAAVALTNTQYDLTAFRYDTYQAPRGSAYRVPAGKTLYLVQIAGRPKTASSTPVDLQMGYADEAVADSISAPTGARVVWEVSWVAVNGPPDPIDVMVPIPEGKYPWVRASSTGNYQATGILK